MPSIRNAEFLRRGGESELELREEFALPSSRLFSFFAERKKLLRMPEGLASGTRRPGAGEEFLTDPEGGLSTWLMASIACRLRQTVLPHPPFSAAVPGSKTFCSAKRLASLPTRCYGRFYETNARAIIMAAHIKGDGVYFNLFFALFDALLGLFTLRFSEIIYLSQTPSPGLLT